MEVPVNVALINVLVAIEAKRNSLIAETHIGLVDDWEVSLKSYFFKTLSNELIDQVRLKKNLACFNEVKMFRVPEKWWSCPSRELGKYSFCYPG